MNSFNEKEKSLTKIMFHSRKQLSKTEKEERTIFPVEKEKFEKKVVHGSIVQQFWVSLLCRQRQKFDIEQAQLRRYISHTKNFTF